MRCGPCVCIYRNSGEGGEEAYEPERKSSRRSRATAGLKIILTEEETICQLRANIEVMCFSQQQETKATAQKEQITTKKSNLCACSSRFPQEAAAEIECERRGIGPDGHHAQGRRHARQGDGRVGQGDVAHGDGGPEEQALARAGVSCGKERVVGMERGLESNQSRRQYYHVRSIDQYTYLGRAVAAFWELAPDSESPSRRPLRKPAATKSRASVAAAADADALVGLSVVPFPAIFCLCGRVRIKGVFRVCCVLRSGLIDLVVEKNKDVWLRRKQKRPLVKTLKSAMETAGPCKRSKHGRDRSQQKAA